MASDRNHDRRGRHRSVGGEAAADALNDLVDQFADPLSFVRELIQNSLDAGALSIDIDMAWANGEFVIQVIDDGEGMDQATIEGYLLTLFRSTKEDDLTKIGKFGIGFVSLFAIDPREVVVDTGRDGVWHRVTFHLDRTWTLERMSDPFEGTTITLSKAARRTEASQLANGIRDAATRWCRFADADVSTSARGTHTEWQHALIRAEFTVASPVSVRIQEDAFEAVVGIHDKTQPPTGFYNHGLTLWEGRGTELDGITFRIKGRHLEHTLTRDSVKRDRHYHRVIKRLRRAVRETLQPAVHVALVDAGTRADQARLDSILRCDRSLWSIDDDLAWIPVVGRQPSSIAALRSDAPFFTRFLGRHSPLFFGRPQNPVTEAIAAQGQLVINADAEGPLARWLTEALPNRYARAVWDHFRFAQRCDVPQALDELLAATQHRADAHGLSMHWGVHTHGFSVAQHNPFTAEEAPENATVQPGPHIIINPEDDFIADIRTLPTEDASYLLLRMAAADSGHAWAPAPGDWT